MIRIILHCDEEWGIGKKGTLMFHLPKDMAYFRETTKGHVVVMGEVTFLSFPNQKPLKNRTNIVLSADSTHNYEGCVNVHSMEELHAKLKEIEANEDIYIIGGASIYKAFLPYCDEALITKVEAIGGADTFFVNLDENPDYELATESEPIQDEDAVIRFTRYINKNKKALGSF